MSFLKFKLDNIPPRAAAPIPIASSRTSPETPPDSQSQSQSSTQSQSQPRPASPAPLMLRDSGPAPEDTKVPWSKRPATPPKAGELSFSLRSWKRIKTRQTTACAECKASKVRCERAAAEPGDACRRCLRLDKQCFFDSKPRTRSTTGRPAAHKEPVESKKMKSVLGQTSESVPPLEAKTPYCFSNGLTGQPSSRPFPSIENKQLDIRIDSLINRETAQFLFYHFINNFVPKAPLVVFVPGTSSDYVRETKPLLFLSILSVSSAGYCTTEKQMQLASESKKALAERALVRGEKSLDIVQSLQVLSLWYRTADDYKQMNLTQLVQITVGMASDLGLDNMNVAQLGDNPQSRWDRAEVQRAWLGCFVLSASVSLILRRPPRLEWTSGMDIYMDDLRRSRVCHSDTFLCELIETEHLCYTADRKLFLSDCAKTISLHDPATLRIIRDLQSRIDGWVVGPPDPLQRSLINFGKFAGSLYVNELIMHVGRNLDEFRAPFAAKSLKTCALMSEQADQARLCMVRRVVLASHGLLDAFLGLSLEDILVLPPHVYGGRVIYTLVLLCKLFKGSMQSTPESRELLCIEELRLDEYLDRMTPLARELIRKDERNPLSRSFLIIDQLKEWYHVHRYQSQRSSLSEGPMMLIDSHHLQRGTTQGSSPGINTTAHQAQHHHHQSPPAAAEGNRGRQHFDPIDNAAARLPNEHLYSSSDRFRTESESADEWFWEDFF